MSSPSCSVRCLYSSVASAMASAGTARLSTAAVAAWATSMNRVETATSSCIVSVSSSAVRVTSSGPKSAMRRARSAIRPAASLRSSRPVESGSCTAADAWVIRRHSSQASRKLSYVSSRCCLSQWPCSTAAWSCTCRRTVSAFLSAPNLVARAPTRAPSPVAANPMTAITRGIAKSFTAANHVGMACTWKRCVGRTRLESTTPRNTPPHAATEPRLPATRRPTPSTPCTPA